MSDGIDHLTFAAAHHILHKKFIRAYSKYGLNSYRLYVVKIYIYITNNYLSYEDYYNTVQLLFRIQIINKGMKSFYEVRFNFSLHCRNSHYY